MGSKTIECVWFICYSHDHPPPHVHGFYAETEVLIDLLSEGHISKIREAGSCSATERENE